MIARLASGLGVPVRWAQHACANPRQSLRLVLATLILGFCIWAVSWRGYGWYHWIEGKRSLRADHCRVALAHFNAALEVWPDDADTLFLAARTARRVGDLGVAEHLLNQCQAASALAEQVALERVLLRACRGELEGVGGFCNALLDQGHPDTPLILEALAEGELALLRFGASAAYLDRWLEQAPDSAQAVFLKGRLQLRAYNSQDAITLFCRAIELDPDRDDARLMLAGLYLDLGQAQEALPHLQLVRRRLPHNPAMLALLGQTLVLLGQQDQAVSVLDDLLKRHPDLASALLERGKIALRDGEMDKAEDWLKSACKRDPGSHAAHYQLLQCLNRRGKTLEARAIQQRLDQIDNDTARLHAITTIHLPHRPHDAALQAELGAIYVDIGVYDEGVRWLNLALHTDPQHGAAHRALAKYYEALGQSSRAEKHRTLAGATERPGSPPK